jgi:hypothetical protein
MKVSVNIASQPKRIDTLKQVVECFQNQTVKPDVIRIWWNGEVKPTIDGVYVESGDNLTDNGKFAFVRPNEYYFTADDDIHYPSDYIEHTLERLQVYPECVITYHGRKLLGKGLRYYADHQAYACLGHLAQDEIIDIPGTGVMAFNSNHFHPYVLTYGQNRMADVLIGCEAVRQKVQVVCMAHGFGWLKDISPDGGIYIESRMNDKVQSKLCDMLYDNKLS